MDYRETIITGSDFTKMGAAETKDKYYNSKALSSFKKSFYVYKHLYLNILRACSIIESYPMKISN